MCPGAGMPHGHPPCGKWPRSPWCAWIRGATPRSWRSLGRSMDQCHLNWVCTECAQRSRQGPDPSVWSGEGPRSRWKDRVFRCAEGLPLQRAAACTGPRYMLRTCRDRCHWTPLRRPAKCNYTYANSRCRGAMAHRHRPPASPVPGGLCDDSAASATKVSRPLPLPCMPRTMRAAPLPCIY